MTSLEFDNFLERVFLVFGRNMPNSKRMKFLFEELSFIPVEACAYIVKKFKNEENNLPTNLIKAVRAYWFDYLRENPKKFDNSNCHNYYCDSGFIWCNAIIDGKYYKIVCLCPDCRGGQSLESLRDKGYEFIDLKKRNINIQVRTKQKEKIMQALRLT